MGWSHQVERCEVHSRTDGAALGAIGEFQCERWLSVNQHTWRDLDLISSSATLHAHRIKLTMHSPTIALFALLATACHGFTVVPAARSAAIASSRRTTTVSANFFDDLKKVAEYNTKFIGTAMSSMFDDRTATASHILFGFAKYNDGQFQANALK